MKLKFNLLFHMIIIFVCTDGATLNTSLKHRQLALSIFNSCRDVDHSYRQTWLLMLMKSIHPLCITYFIT